MSFSAYPEYKAYGFDWLPEVPAHWDDRKIARDIPFVIGWTPPSGKDEYYDGDLPWVTIADMTQMSVEDTKSKISHLAVKDKGAKIVPAGTMLFSFKLSVGKVAFLKIDSYTNEAIAGFLPCGPLDLEYWKYAAPEFIPRYGRENIYGATLLNQELISSVRFSAPAREEQTQIARFLDHETARIDALIEEQQRLIELLKEKRQVVISHAVTKGLDATVLMKDSGVEWLGEVPAHWKVSKLGHYAQILTGFPFPSASFSHDESDVRLLRGANIGVGSLKWIDTVYWSLSEGDNLSSYLMEEGQIVLGMDRPWISEGMRIARVTNEDMPCLLLQRVAAISPSAELDDEYLFCLLASELFKTYVEPDLTGVSVPHISPEQIMSFQISVPEIGEQRRISSFIRNQLDQMTALFEQASESVELLQERRSALIAAAVTGKIDVRGWQPPASASTPELEQEAV